MKKYVSGNFFHLVDIGKVREQNEDFASARINAYGQLMLVVCDGMGGKNKGDYASKKLGDGLLKAFLDNEKEFVKPNAAVKWLYKNINSLNREIYQKSKSDSIYKGMGTTLTVAIIYSDNLIIGQVGDSRLYRLSENKLEQVTVDQTYVQHLNNAHKLTKEQISSHPERHKLTNAIGIKYNASVDLKIMKYNGEKLLLCTDGLYNNVPLLDIKSVLNGKDSLERKAIQLVRFGNFNGGSDNMGLVIWENNN